jgi:hypothetical protein
LLLIALSAKNAVLIVEVAREHRATGEPIIDSAVDAAQIRFRSIIMTSFAFILGVLPLAFATGAGADFSRPDGVHRMLANTCLAVVFVPSFFWCCKGWRSACVNRRSWQCPIPRSDSGYPVLLETTCKEVVMSSWYALRVAAVGTFVGFRVADSPSATGSARRAGDQPGRGYRRLADGRNAFGQGPVIYGKDHQGLPGSLRHHLGPSDWESDTDSSTHGPQ